MAYIREKKDSKSMDEDTNLWSQIFTLQTKGREGASEKEYRQAVERNRNIYQDIPVEFYRTIEDCVEYAIAKGSHGAFVHYYLERACDGDDLFYDTFQKYIVTQQNSVITSMKDLQKCLIVKPKYWRSPDVFLDEDTLGESVYFYTEALLGKQGKEREDPYWSKPSREALIQYGFYLGLHEKQVNELLLLAGFQSLYPCDPADGICIYYLNQLAGKEGTYHFVSQFDGRRNRLRLMTDKLILVKKEINRISEQVGIRTKMCFGQERVKILLREKAQLLAEEEEVLSAMDIVYRTWKGQRIIADLQQPDQKALQALHLSWNPEKKSLARNRYVRIPAFSSKLMEYQNGQWNIVTEVEKLAADIGYVPENQEEMLAMYPTLYLKGQMEGNQWIEELAAHGTFKRYGYLYQSRQFLNSRGFEKNLYYTAYPLTKDTRVSLEQKEQEGFSVTFSSGLEKRNGEKIYISEEAERFCRIQGGTDFFRNEDLLYQVWKLKNLFGEEKSLSHGRLPEFSTLSHILYGRRQIQEDWEKAGKKQSKEKYYEYESGDKVSAVQMALATGSEEFLGKYLCLAGFWNQDLYRDYVPKDGECYERLDAFVIYLLMYRDALIQVWTDDFFNRERAFRKDIFMDQSRLMEEIRKQFPLIRLAMTINQDIQFVLRELIVPKGNEKRDYFYRYLASMVYPVRASSKRWYEEYAKAEYFDEETGKLRKKKERKK